MKTETFIKQIIIKRVLELRENEIYGLNLIGEIFNNDYFVIGDYDCNKWLEKNGNVFNAMNKVKSYENDIYHEVFTDLTDAQKLCNMYIFILTEEMLGEVKHLRSVWNSILTQEDYDIILEELK